MNTAGGSLGYFISKKNIYKKTINYKKFLNNEIKLNLLKNEIYVKFKKNCENSKKNLIKLLESIVAKKNTICGYAATSKSTTIFNYCNISRCTCIP